MLEQKDRIKMIENGKFSPNGIKIIAYKEDQEFRIPEDLPLELAKTLVKNKMAKWNSKKLETKSNETARKSNY